MPSFTRLTSVTRLQARKRQGFEFKWEVLKGNSENDNIKEKKERVLRNGVCYKGEERLAGFS